MGIITDAVKSLTFDRVNKVKGNNDEQQQGVVSDLLPELTLTTDDEALIKLAKKWESGWNKFKSKKDIDKRQEKSENYWLGKQDEKNRRFDEDNSPDNLIFESLETFLPIATRENPEAVVTSGVNSTESQEYNTLVKEMLTGLADEIRLRLKIKGATRNWALSLLGVVKVAWNLETQLPTVYIVRSQKIILDPNSTIEECRYTGRFIGEYKQETAEDMVARFPEKKEFISTFVEQEMGTVVQYCEWWTKDMVFWTLEKEVLGKMKNPHWDYGEEINETVDEMGNAISQALPALNHFSTPRMPYCFLSVFNLGKHPIDDTSLIEQVIPMQDDINMINRQIRRNVTQMNGCVAVSSDFFNKDQAKSVADARRDGRPILVPGNPNDAIKDLVTPSISSDVFEFRNDNRNELRGVYGVTGATPQGIASEDTVRGKILVREQDSSRIGGGITTYIEQFADEIYNWLVQMIYVYGEEPDLARILGPEKAARFFELLQFFGQIRLIISVKEGSLIPKDSLSEANQAVDLFEGGGLDPLTMYEKLDYPNPEQTAQRLALWKMGQVAPGNTAVAPPPTAEQVPEPVANPLNQVPLTS